MIAPSQITFLGHTFELTGDDLMPWGLRRCEYKSSTAYFEIQMDYGSFLHQKDIRIWVGSDYISFCDIFLDEIDCEMLNAEAQVQGMLCEFAVLQIA